MINIVKSITKFLLESKEKKSKEEQITYIKGISILDQISKAKEDNKEQLINDFVKDFISPNGPCIYAFVTNKVKDAIKIGYTDQHPEKRIEQWKEIYGKNAGEVTCLGYWSSEEFNQAGERVFFWDHAIHKKISDKKYKQLSKEEFMATLTDEGKKIKDIHYSREFFSKYKRLITGELDPNDKEELSEQLIEDIIKQMKINIKAGTEDFKLYSFDKEGNTLNKEADKIWGSPSNYSNTKLQEEAIENGVNALKNGKKNLLMAAVMRFGKTHASYEIIKQAGLKKVIVCSAKADVRTAWREDINHVHFYKDFVFIEILDKYKWDITYYKNDKLITEHKNIYEQDNVFDIYKDKTIIFFFTLHDLGGSISEIKAKHRNIFNNEFDLMVVDETHYGSHANTFGKITKLDYNIEDDNTDIEEEKKLAKETEEGIKKLNIKYKSILQVSGTPYYILASNEMIDKDAEIISKVSYTDMLNARDEWNKEHKDEDPSNSPYFGIPTLHKIGLRLTKECIETLKDKNITDSLTALFETKGNKFKYEDAVKSLMKSIFGDGSKDSLSFLSNKKVDGNKICKHTLIVLPRVNSCKAMKDLLSSFIDTNERKIFCIVGNEGKIADVKDVDDLNNKLYELDNKGKKSIILTVNRFLTGVSMPCVDSMIYLKNASSPQEYDQNIFRLCTRYVKNVKNPDNNSRSKKVNMKDNVYLIDFNIANMLKMINNSARMKAAAEGNPTIERIKELMIDDLKATPIFAETNSSDEILSKMKKLDNKDLMKIYTGYNKNKSINDIVDDEIDLFDLLFVDKKYKDFQDIVLNLSINADKSKIKLDIDDEGDTDINTQDFSINKQNTEKTQKDSLSEYINKQDDKKRAQLTKEKFKAITKNLLYCNICLDEPCPDLESIIKKSKEDIEFKTMLSEFKVSLADLWKAYKMMGTNFKQSYNSLICRMAQLAQDTSIDNYEKFSNALKGLGRLGKNEVVTPPEIVNKMIDKLSKENYDKAESILIVNDKQAEFLIGIHKKFGKKITEKCKVVPSSEIGKHLCKKIAKSIGIKDTENTILNINDIDGNGYYDVNDFLKMKNEEILKMNDNKKWDVVLMNPPYGAKEDGNYLDIKFTNKCIEICDKVISIQPAKLTSNAGIYKTFFDKNIIKDIELLDPYNTFKISPFGAYKYVGIFNIDPNKTFDKLHLTLNNSEYNIENTFEERSKFINEQNWDKNIRELIDKKESLRKELFKKYNSMVNDGHGFIYEENRLQRGKRFNVIKKDNHALDRVKQYLKDSKYKYCIYKGSGNHSYDKPQEWLHQDVDKLFKGQVCWLTNSKNVKDNIIYWMETPIFDLWRLYYFNHSKYTVGCMYGHLPALNFEMNEKEFKDYVDSLNNFTKEEIQILKDNNIHNADKL